MKNSHQGKPSVIYSPNDTRICYPVYMHTADKHLCKDTKLSALVRYFTLPELVSNREPFHSLVRSVLSQQLSTRAASTIISRFEKHCQGEVSARKIVALETPVLRTIGVSRQKSAYLHHLAEHVIRNEDFWSSIDDKTSTEIQLELTSIKGIGIWTAQMFLMFNLKRPDILPLGDLAIRESMCKLYSVSGKGKRLERKLQAIGKAWSPHRTRASRYLWAWRDNGYNL